MKKQQMKQTRIFRRQAPPPLSKPDQKMIPIPIPDFPKQTTDLEWPKASVILRYANKSPLRLRNLKLIVDYIRSNQDLEIILSVMEDDIPPGIIEFNQKVRKIFNQHPFESSKANNIGANAARSDIFIFQDADIIFRPAYYKEIIEAIKQKGFESVIVGQNCVNLCNVVVSQLVGDRQGIDVMLQRGLEGAVRDAPGGASAISRSAFIRIGGFCELFKVYGWEDCYYRFKMNKLTKRLSLNVRLCHLFHEENYQAKHQQENAYLYSELLSHNNGDCIDHAERDKEFLLEKYVNLKAE